MSIVAGKFPSDAERQTLAALKKYAQLYDNEAKDVLGVHDIIKKQYKNEKSLVYISHAIPARITDFYADFVAGDIDRLVIQGADDKEQTFIDELSYENDLPESIIDFASDQSEFGYVALYAYKTADGTTKITAISADQYFPQQNGSVIIATYKKDPDDTLKKALILLTQHFRMEGDDCVIERQAWKCDEKGVGIQEVALEKMAALLGMQFNAVDRITGIGMLPIVQVNNGRRRADGFGKSDYNDIIPQLAEINERRTHVSTQLLKNLDAKMQLPSGMKDDDGNVKPFDTVFLESKDQPEAKYITNTNDLIEKAEEHILGQMRVISEITGVPMFSLLKGGMPERVESLRIQLFSAVRKTHRKRAKLIRGLQDIIRVAYKLDGKDMPEDPIIKFSDVVPSDPLIDAETEATKVRAGLSSRVNAIQRLSGVSEQEAQAELKTIQEEETTFAGLDPQPPQIV